MKPAPVVGVFDSGVGGLSVLRALRMALPGAHFIYLADEAMAPYGERDATVLRERITAMVNALHRRHPLDAMVVACNTATAVAIDDLRRSHPTLPFVGIEPALRPALRQSMSGQVGVVATRATLSSERYARLRASCLDEAPASSRLIEQPCDGLAEAIESGDENRVAMLCNNYLGAIRDRAPSLDTLVLGCTHYPLAARHWEAGEGLTLIDPAEAVARRTQALLQAGAVTGTGSTTLLSTGTGARLGEATRRWLDMTLPVRALPPDRA